MAAPRLSDEVLIAAVELRRMHPTIAAAARAADMPRGTLDSRLQEAARRGFMLDAKPAMPGFVIKETSTQTGPDGELLGQSVRQVREPGEVFAVPQGHSIKGVSALLDPEGRELAKWVKTREGVLDPLALADSLKAAFTDYTPAAAPVPAPAPETVEADLLTLIPVNDLHLGMFAWGKEVDANWDLKIAEEILGREFDSTISRSMASGEAVVLGGGDLFHADNRRNETANGTPQDVDGRYQKVVQVATRLLVRIVDGALRRHGRVIVRILPGNHDEHASVAVAYFLLAWFRNDPRVTVDTSPSLFWWHRFGSCMFGATHGHTVKIAKMPEIMAHRRPEDWGATKHRYIHGFHLHHTAKTLTEGGGCVCEIHQAPVPQDAWHYGAGYMSGRSTQAITYHRDFGERARVRAAILDADTAGAV